MEFFSLLLVVWIAYRMTRTARAAADAVRQAAAALADHQHAMAEACAALAEVAQGLANLRRDLRAEDGGDDPIPPDAPDPLGPFLARRAARAPVEA